MNPMDVNKKVKAPEIRCPNFFNWKLLQLLPVLVLTINFAYAQNANKISNKILLGYFEFSENRESGLTLTNETIFEFNNILNPGIRLSICSGMNSNNNQFSYLMYCNSISANAYLNIFQYKRHRLKCAGGFSFLHVNFNNIVNKYSGLLPYREVYDVVSVGYNKMGYNWLIAYEYNLSGNWFVGLDFQQMYSKYNIKISTFSVTSNFIFQLKKQ